MQSDALNEGGLHTIMAIPLTTNLMNADALGNVVITKAQSGLSKDCMTIPFQMYPLDRARFIEQVGEVSEKVMRRVEDGLLQVLDIRV
jgi:mRNA-degrading endonuclease toxin of MazEF toxin-antitoxin module